MRIYLYVNLAANYTQNKCNYTSNKAKDSTFILSSAVTKRKSMLILNVNGVQQKNTTTSKGKHPL